MKRANKFPTSRPSRGVTLGSIPVAHFAIPTTLPHLARRLDVLRHDQWVFILAHKLETEVSFEADKLVFIRCEALDLTMWGQSLAEAEEAFAFAFFALYQNYYLAADAELAPDALRLKGLRRALLLETEAA